MSNQHKRKMKGNPRLFLLLLVRKWAHEITDHVLRCVNTAYQQISKAVQWIVIFFYPVYVILVEIRGLLILLSVELFSAIFLLSKTGDWQTVYPYFCNNWMPLCLSRVELTRDTHVYFIFEHLRFIMLSLYIYYEPKKFPKALLTFVAIQVIDLFDYLIGYSQTWVYIGTCPISWNILKVVIFMVAIFNEVSRIIERKLNIDS